MRLLATHEIDVAHLAAGVAGQGRGPHQACGAVAEQIDGGDRREIVWRREPGERLWRSPGVAGLVEVENHFVPAEINDVGGAGAVDVGKPDALLVELVGRVEQGRVAHRDLSPEAPVP